MNEYDAIVIGAGHNGLATGAILAKRGLRVLQLEKNDYVGGMAGTREILTGCRNDVGATFLFPVAPHILEEFDFEANGVEFVDLPIMATNVHRPDAPAFVLHKNVAKMAGHVLVRFGIRAMLGFVRLMLFCKAPAAAMGRFAGGVPSSINDILSRAKNDHERDQLRIALTGSAMELVDQFLPPEVARFAPLRSMLAFVAIQSTYKGPYSPGSAMCLIYTLAGGEAGGLMRRVKGGMGCLSEALARVIKDRGGEIRMKARVERILIEDGQAVGVRLRGGEEIRARVVVSNLDKHATFFGLIGREHLSSQLEEQLDSIIHRGAYVHIVFRLSRLPQYAGDLARLNRDPNTRFNTAIVPDPKDVQAAFEDCKAGRLPTSGPIALQIPTVVDPSLAPKGEHIGVSYGFYYPCEAPKKDKGKLRDDMAEHVVDRLCEFMPDFRDCIMEKAVFSSDHFAAMHGATEGDFTHGLIHPEQMLSARTLREDSAHATPIDGLFLCGASCHPGPGVTFLPGYACGQELAEILGETEARQ